MVETTSAAAMLAAYVDSEFDYEWRRKTSLETRAFALVTANLAMVTLYLAVRAQSTLLAVIQGGAPRCFAVVAFALIAISTFAAVISAAPMRYAGPHPDAFQELANSLQSEKAASVQKEIIEARIAQLSRAFEANNRKATYAVFAFICTAGSAVALAGALIFAAS